jgi:hypothetical protein
MPEFQVNRRAFSEEFNELEQRLLRFLQEEFLQKGSRPRTMLDPATKHGDVMAKFGLDLPQYREIIARLEPRGLVRGIALGRSYGHLQISPQIVDLVRELGTGPGTPRCVHNADFTMVNWFGTEYHFALGVQSSAVRALWEEWEKTRLGLHQETIREAIDTEQDSFRMDTAFRKHPAFGTMIQRGGDGRYRLVQPVSQAASES